MTLLLSVDPGIDTGWATWLNGKLYACGLGQGWKGMFDRAIIELPQVYPKIPAKQANDLITLAVRVGQYKERLELIGTPVTLVHPHRWKGSIKKEIHHRRVFAKLDPAEQFLTLPWFKDGDSYGKGHNVMDAIGLGLYELKRLVPGIN